VQPLVPRLAKSRKRMSRTQNENDSGDYLTTRARDMRAFDLLPRKLRHALAEADHRYAAEWVLDLYRRGQPVHEIIKRLRRGAGA
jgi:hypothetical protein